MNKYIYIIMYHYIRNIKKSRFPNIKGLEFNDFKEQIKYLNFHFNFISMEDLLEFIYVNKKLPENPVLLTFDDGYIDHYNYVFSILNEYKIKAAFYPPSMILTGKLLDINKIHILLSNVYFEFILKDLFYYMDCFREKEFKFLDNDDLFKKYAQANRFDNKEIIFIKRILQKVLPSELRQEILNILFKKYINIDEEIISNEYYMNYEQIKHLRDSGMHIGIHGDTHNWLAEIDEINMRSEINISLDILSKFIDKNNWTMCYPYNSYNENVISYIKEKESKLGLTANPGPVNINKINPFELFRYDTNDFYPISSNYQKFINK